MIVPPRMPLDAYENATHTPGSMRPNLKASFPGNPSRAVRVSTAGALLVLVFFCVFLGFRNREQFGRIVRAHSVQSAIGTVLGYRVEHDVMIRMRDGVSLSTNFYIPELEGQRVGTVLVRTPYGKDYVELLGGDLFEFLRKGYAVAVQDMRGKYGSEGHFAPYRHEASDGSDTVDWLATQPWSNGRVGTYGCSASGETQILLARERNPHHAAMIALSPGGALGSAGGRHGYFGMYEGGVFNLASGFGWFVANGGRSEQSTSVQPTDMLAALRELPTQGLVARYRSSPTEYEDFISRPPGDRYWHEMGFVEDGDDVATPALIFDTWQDQSVAGTLTLAELMRRSPGRSSSLQHVIIAPGNHCDYIGPGKSGRVGDLPIGDAARQDFRRWMVEWYDFRLKGEVDRAPALPTYRYYVLGEDVWEDSEQWPPKGVRFERWFLGGSLPANSLRGGGTLSLAPPTTAEHHDEFFYDPQHPVPSVGGPVCCTGNPDERAGPIDQLAVEQRSDVLVYTSAPVTETLRIVGPLKAELYVGSSARDTDFMVKLVDVWPDGRALNIQEGALRMRYRDGYAAAAGAMQPEEVYLARIDLRAIAYALKPGHRVRLQVTSSNFPRLERNLNTGGNNYDETAGIIAVNRVYKNRDHASSVVLPVEAHTH